MSEPLRQKIAKSSAADRMLESVTKGFYDRSYVGLWIYEILGQEMDDVVNWTEDLQAQAYPQTATWSLPYWEDSCQLTRAPGLSIEARRFRILQAMTGRRPINPDRIERLVSVFTGGPVKVEENPRGQTFRIVLDSPETVDVGLYRRIYSAVRELRPAQLTFSVSVTEPDPLNTNIYVGGAILSERLSYRMNPVPKNEELGTSNAYIGSGFTGNYKTEALN